jgi:GntR family transcriptional regulator
MMINKNSSESLTSQLEHIFKKKIKDNEWKVDTLIPSELSLAKAYDVSRTTVHLALVHLESQGLIFRIPGKGTAVASPKPVLEITSESIREQLYDQKWAKSFKVLECQAIKADSKISSFLQCNIGDPVLYLCRLYYKKQSEYPILLQHSYIHANYIKYLDIPSLKTTSIHRQLKKHHIETSLVNEWLAVSEAHDYEAIHLDIPVCSPLLVLEELRYDKNELPFYYTKVLSRGDSLKLFFSKKISNK